jgi:hypothetical protein
MTKRITASFVISVVAFTELCLHITASILTLVAIVVVLVCGGDAIAQGEPLLYGITVVAFIIGAMLFKASGYFFGGGLTDFVERKLNPQNPFAQMAV